MAMEARHATYSVEEYLRLEEYSNVKHEYLDGEVHAMAGGTPEHGAIAARVIAAFVEQPHSPRSPAACASPGSTATELDCPAETP